MKHLRQVKASAGSGKTYELTRCFLQRLVASGPPASASASSACVLSPGGAGGWGVRNSLKTSAGMMISAALRIRPDCTVETDIDTLTAHDGATGARLQGPAYRDALKACQAVGATVEGSTKARDQATQAALAFLKKVFGL